MDVATWLRWRLVDFLGFDNDGRFVRDRCFVDDDFRFGIIWNLKEFNYVFAKPLFEIRI